MKQIMIAAGLVLVACGGSFEMSAIDGGSPEASSVAVTDASPTTGCYGDGGAGDMLACSDFIGRWCWAKPNAGSPGSGCVLFPASSPVAFSYWCCP